MDLVLAICATLVPLGRLFARRQRRVKTLTFRVDGRTIRIPVAATRQAARRLVRLLFP